ncbi:hypothetical protein H5410_055055 [Solanum commersonii]|uniref:Uncharacterized protein n=1 Tax=Solanum commersonii TaxID=4109 RepID=A0A9J5WGK1_SOLCO|nr:hypothetical protein H5410_055055 [Solanum commersonii]
MDDKSLNQNFLDEEVMDDEFEKVEGSAFNVLKTNKMYISTLIQSLEDEGMVNSQFRSVYLLKKEQPPSFFRNLVLEHVLLRMDALFLLKQLIKSRRMSMILYASNSLFDLSTSRYVARNLNQAYHELHNKFKSLMKLEKEIGSAEEKALGLKASRFKMGKSICMESTTISAGRKTT